MNRLEELTFKLTDGELPEPEERELRELLADDPAAREAHSRLLELEATLRGRRTCPDLSLSVLSRIKSECAETIPERVLHALKSEAGHEPAAYPAVTELADGMGRNVVRPFPNHRKLAWPLTIAAGIALLLSVGVWHFGPTMGDPVMAGVVGSSVEVERGVESFPMTNGMRLLPGDVLRTGANSKATVAFGAEATRFHMGAETALQFASVRSGKKFFLRVGKLEADVARQRPFSPLVVATPNAEAVVVGTRFTLTATTNHTRLEVMEGKVRLVDTTNTDTKPAAKVGAGHYAVVAPATELAALPATGRILLESWSGVPGPFIHDLLDDDRFPNQPHGREFPTALELTPITTNSYGCRIRGYFHPQITGDHIFWLAGDGAAELFISLSEDPAERFRICVSTKAGVRQWDIERLGGDSPISNPFHLVAGRRYYMEALLKVNQGGGHLSVAWQQPGKPRALISGEFLSPVELR